MGFTTNQIQFSLICNFCSDKETKSANPNTKANFLYRFSSLWTNTKIFLFKSGFVLSDIWPPDHRQLKNTFTIQFCVCIVYNLTWQELDWFDYCTFWETVLVQVKEKTLLHCRSWSFRRANENRTSFMPPNLAKNAPMKQTVKDNAFLTYWQ